MSTRPRSGRAIELENQLAESLAALKTEQGARYLIQNFLYRHVQAHKGADYYTPFFIRSEWRVSCAADALWVLQDSHSR